jgi:PIN domain nuclease of toxin-antitoxin system
MNLLLDTHALIWWLEDSPRLGKSARHAVRALATTRTISVVSAWEIVIKIGIGRLKLSVDPEESIPELFFNGFEPLSIQFRHAYALRDLPPHHSDPFDRMLVAQAKTEGLTILTADPKIAAYGVPTFDASQ